MAVLVVNASSDLYGANRILLHTIKFLKPRKIVLVLPSQGLLTEKIFNDQQYNHVQVIISSSIPFVFKSMVAKDYLNVLLKMQAFKRLVKKIAKTENIEWAYVNTLSCFLVIRSLRSIKIRVFLHVHEILENGRSVTKYINKHAVKYSDRIIAVSNAVKQNLLKVCNEVYKQKLVTVLNGIADKYSFTDNESSKDTSRVTVLLLARIKPEKGIWFFLDALALLPEQVTAQSKFLIIGSAAPGHNNYVNKLKTDIQLNPARNNIKYEEFKSNIDKVLNESDIVVVPSLMKDPFPTTILESLSTGKPVIATNTGGSVESVTESKTGFLIEANNTREFADRLRQLITSTLLRKEMGIQARKEYLKNFTLEIFENNFLKEVNVFENMLC